MASGKETSGVVQIVVAELAKEEYGIPIMQVQEIIKPPEITRIPNMPDFLEGIINLRGKIIPIIDLRKRFHLEEKGMTEETRVVVTNIEGQSIGLVADSVSDVIRLAQDSIDPIPSMMSQIDSEFLSGVGKLDKRIIILLNIEKVFSDLEKASLKKIETENQAS